MNHLAEEQLVDAYYGDLAPALREHIRGCGECARRLDGLKTLLDAVRESPLPERGPAYGSAVWTRLLPSLPVVNPRRSLFLRWWTLAPALAALLLLAFLAGTWTARHAPAYDNSKSRERVLLLALSEHLERSQIILAELMNQPPGSPGVAGERDRARDLLEENRLLRQTASLNGDKVHAALLDELERTLLAIANGPSSDTPGDVEQLQRRIENQNLLWKVRITSTDAREKGQKL